MRILENYSLKNENSFKIDVSAKYFAQVSNIDEILKIINETRFRNENLQIIGGGSNILFTRDFDGLVIKIAIKGINLIKEDNNSVFLRVGAGENWNGFVQYCVNNGYAGIENMSLIPGTAGAAAAQNIAAYGQNIEDVFESLEAIDLQNLKLTTFTKSDCRFAYRDSYFKNKGRGKFIITDVNLRLSKKPIIDTSYHSRYESLIGELEKFTSAPYNIRDISKAVTVIRERKFPDWEKIGTAGSFFLNPVVTKDQLAVIQKKAPGVQFYPVDKLTYPTPNDPTFDHENHVKVAAGWLFEELGWKGKRIGKVGTSPNQALVVINYGGATSRDILNFTDKMRDEFKNAYDIDLEPEVNII